MTIQDTSSAQQSRTTHSASRAPGGDGLSRDEQRQHALLARALEISNAGHFDLDLSTGRWTSSEGLDTIFGIGPDFPRTVEGWIGLVPEEDRGELLSDLEASLAPDGPHLNRVYRIRADDTGEEKWVMGSGILQLDDAGRPSHFFGLVRDVTGSVHKGRRLREQSEQLTTIIDGAGLGTWDWHIPSGAVHFNHRWAGMLGYELEEVAPSVSSWEALVHPDDMDRVMTRLTDHLEGRAPLYSVEHRLFHKDGSIVWVHDVGRVIERDGEGHPVRAAGIHLDITDQMRTKEEARTNLIKYRTLLRTQPLGVVVTDLSGVVREANPAARTMLGADPEGSHLEELASSGYEMIRPDGAPLPPEGFASLVALREGRPVQGFEMGIRRPDGSILWVVVDSTPLDLPEYGVISTYVDVTDLKEREARYQTVFDSIQDIVFTLDPEGRHTGVIGNWVSELGLSAEDFLGRTASEILGPDLASPHLAANARALRGDAVVYEWEAPSPEGTRHIETSLTPIRNWGGDVVGLVGVGRDITSRVEAERDRLAMQKRMVELQRVESLAKLAGGVAHDFNNLLMGVLLNVEVLKGQFPEESPAMEILEDIHASGTRAADLARQMLAYSGKGRFALEPLDPRRVLEAMEPVLRSSVHPDVALQLHLDADTPSVTADPAQFRQVVHSVVQNASDAMEGSPGCVTLSTHRMMLGSHGPDLRGDAAALSPGEYAVVQVRDSGTGMDDAVAERIFDPFFTTRFTGRGLGLAAAQGIMKGHGGAILFETGVDSGSVFHLLFPAAAPADGDAGEYPEGSSSEVTPSRTDPGSITVLLVDDEDLVRRVGTRLLKKLGCRVLHASDGVEALDVFDGHPGAVDLAILDMTMPRMDGPATMRELRKRDGRLKVIMISGYDEASLEEHPPVARPDAFLQKPFRFQELQERFLEVLG